MHRSTPLLRVVAAAAILLPAAASAQTRVAEKPDGIAEAANGAPAPAATASADTRTSAKRAKAALPPAPTALEAAAKDIASASRAGSFRHPRTGVLVPAGAVQAVVAIMDTPSAEADAQVMNALMMSGEDEGAALQIMGALPRLLADPSPSRVSSAQKHLERFMENAPASYRDHPPAEVQAIDGIIARMAMISERSQPAADRTRNGAREARKNDERSAKAAEQSAHADARRDEKAERKAAKKAKEQAEKEARARARAEKEALKKAEEARKQAERVARQNAEREARAAKSARSSTKPMTSSLQSAPTLAPTPQPAARKDGAAKKVPLWRRLLPFV